MDADRGTAVGVGHEIVTSTAIILGIWIGFMAGSVFYLLERRAHKKTLALFRETLDRYGEYIAQNQEVAQEMLDVSGGVLCPECGCELPGHVYTCPHAIPNSAAKPMTDAQRRSHTMALNYLADFYALMRGADFTEGIDRAWAAAIIGDSLTHATRNSAAELAWELYDGWAYETEGQKGYYKSVNAAVDARIEAKRLEVMEVFGERP